MAGYIFSIIVSGISFLILCTLFIELKKSVIKSRKVRSINKKDYYIQLFKFDKYLELMGGTIIIALIVSFIAFIMFINYQVWNINVINYEEKPDWCEMQMEIAFKTKIDPPDEFYEKCLNHYNSDGSLYIP